MQQFREWIKQGTKIDFVGMQVFNIGISFVVFFAALIFMYVKGMNYGIEFTGGIEIRVKLSGESSRGQDLRDALDAKGFAGSTIQDFIDLPNVYSIKVKGGVSEEELGGKTISEKTSEIITTIEDKIGKGNVELISTDMIGARVGKTLKTKGLYAFIFAMLGILVYVGFRFNFRYAPGGVVGIMHDVVIVAGLNVLLGREMNLTVIASLLTLAGYSINDTIIIFDRIREGEGKMRGKPLRDIINASINQTLSRTILTAFTVFIVTLCLFVFGSSVLRDFALPMLIGTVLGCYSSIFVAAPIFLWLHNLAEKYGKRRRR